VGGRLSEQFNISVRRRLYGGARFFGKSNTNEDGFIVNDNAAVLVDIPDPKMSLEV